MSFGDTIVLDDLTEQAEEAATDEYLIIVNLVMILAALYCAKGVLRSLFLLNAWRHYAGTRWQAVTYSYLLV